MPVARPRRDLLVVATVALLLAALAVLVPDRAGATTGVMINEIRIDQPGTDNDEYFELAGPGGTTLDGYTYLVIGDGTGGSGVVEAVVDLTGHTIGSSGFFVAAESTFSLGTADLSTTLDFENSDNVTHLLVHGFSGSTGQDLDTDDDGILEVTPWGGIADSVALIETGGSGDLVYSDTTVGPDGSFVPGHVFLCTDGWRIGAFNPAGGKDTPDAENACGEEPPLGDCGDTATFIFDIQDSGASSPLVGQVHTVEAVVVGAFQDTGQLGGYFLQEEASDSDGDPQTSDGIFVFDSSTSVSAGDVVRVQGTVTEFFGLTELTDVQQSAVCGTGTVTPTDVVLPVSSVDDWEDVEGMLVRIPHMLYVSGNFTQGRFGEVDLSVDGPLDNPTNVVTPGSAANALQDLNDRSRIQLDDGSTVENPLPLPPYLGTDGTLRTGDTIPDLTGVLSFGFGNYEIHPTGPVVFTRENDRPTGPPDVGGSLKVAAFNVLNYFTTLDDSGPVCGPAGNQNCRGADTSDELTRQRDKLVAAMAALDADIVGLMEIENHPSDVPTADLVAGLNDVLGTGTYDYIATGAIGTDAIRVAIIYKPVEVTPLGSVAVLDSSVDSRFNDEKNRPVLAQTFAENGTDDVVTVAVNHLKSKGSPCDDVGDPDLGDGQGNCNLTRKAAAEALVDWLATDPTSMGGGQYLIIGDLNSYAMEDPIAAIDSASYTDLIETFVGTGWGDGAYSFNFFAQSGYLDHALSSAALTPRITGADFWHVNADEPAALDYNDFNQPALYNADEFRSSDHDPVVVGVCETTAPLVDVTATPDSLWPPNHKYRTVSTSVSVTDADPNATITLVSVTSNEPDNGEDDGNTVNDIVILDDFNFKLRAERSGSGTGRVYTITYDATDACGNTTTASATVTVPLDQD